MPLDETHSLLSTMTQQFPETEFWNDSCEEDSLKRAIAQGATGATSNPIIVLAAIQQDPERWTEITKTLIEMIPGANEEVITWELIEHAVGLGADLLRPVFEATNGQRGRLSVQVNPKDYGNFSAMCRQAITLDAIRENIAVKIPATRAGIEVIEYLTSVGITTNATVSYTVVQAIAVAEAVERGLAQRVERGWDTSGITPWVTIMVGRIEDHLVDERDRLGLNISDDTLAVSGEAVFKRAYEIFQSRRYRAKLLAAAMRGTRHWEPFIGGDCVITIPPKWQDTFNASGVIIQRRMADPADPVAIAQLLQHLEDFRKAYEPDGMPREAFEHFGAVQKTLKQFIGGYEDLLAFVRDIMLPKA